MHLSSMLLVLCKPCPPLSGLLMSSQDPGRKSCASFRGIILIETCAIHRTLMDSMVFHQGCSSHYDLSRVTCG
jgi:hypothetical protein